MSVIAEIEKKILNFKSSGNSRKAKALKIGLNKYIDLKKELCKDGYRMYKCDSQDYYLGLTIEVTEENRESVEVV